MLFSVVVKQKNMIANYNELPQKIEAVGDGSSRFRFLITELENGYQCHEVIVQGAVNSDKVVAAVMDEMWGNGVEQKLINDYNEFKLTGENPEAEAAYLEFLQLRKELKTYIKSLI